MERYLGFGEAVRRAIRKSGTWRTGTLMGLQKNEHHGIRDTYQYSGMYKSLN